MDVDSFIGLDCRLKISGMVADLFIMEILNSAMDDAYGRICSDKGDIGRLNDRSRFCELAIVQLNWCLRFVQEEVDTYIVKSGRGREKLVKDLEDTRDKMQMRMEEIEEEIKDKDRELTERKGVELELRRELNRVRKKVGEIGGEDEEESEVEVEVEVEVGFDKKSRDVEEQFRRNLAEHVERGRIQILEEVKNFNLVDAAAADSEVDFVNDCFDLIGVEIDEIEGKVEENLDTMDADVPVSTTTLEEKQQWTGQVENKILDILVSKFLTNIWSEFSKDSSDKGLLSRDSLHMNSSQFSKELEKLEEQLEEVFAENCNAENANSVRSSPLQKRTLKTSASHGRVDDSRNDEDDGGCSSSKNEELQEERKRLLSMGNNKDLDFFRGNIRAVLSRIELIIKETNRLHETFVPHNLQIDDCKNLKIEIAEDPSSIDLKEITNRSHHESGDHDFETQISDYLFGIIFREVREQWNDDMEIIEIGRAVREKVKQTVLHEIIKDFQNKNSQKDKRLLLNDKEQEPVVLQTAFPESQNWDLNVQITATISNIVFCEMMKQWNYEIRSLKFQTIRCNCTWNTTNSVPSTVSIEADDSFSLVNRKLEKTVEQIALSKMQLKELGTSLGMTFDMDQDPTNSNFSSSLDDQHLIHSPVMEELYQQQIVSALNIFFQMVMDFEEVVQGKIRMSMSRLAGLENHLHSIVNQVVSLGKKKSLYEQAFRRRCSDLQLAETEVDMLGDEIDALLSLLEKIYIALKNISSVSQQKSRMIDVLNLIWKALHNDSTA